MKINKIHIGQAIEAEIKKQGITQSSVASKYGCTPQSISNFLNKESMQTDMLLKFSEILNVNFFELFCETKQANIASEGAVQNFGEINANQMVGKIGKIEDSDIQGMSSSPKNQENTIEHLKDRLRDKEEIIAEKTSRIDDLKEHNKELKEQLAELKERLLNR